MASMLLPLPALVGVEMLMRWSGFGGYEPILKQMEHTRQGRLVVSQKAGARDVFFANPARPGFNDEYAFCSPKGANTVRIVLVGGSAIKGVPQTRRFATSAFLNETLSDCWPDRTGPWRRSTAVITRGTEARGEFSSYVFSFQARYVKNGSVSSWADSVCFWSEQR